MTIRLITLKTNHTFICDLVDNSEDEIVVKKPAQVVMQPTKDGPMMAFIPFLEYSVEFNSGLCIGKDDILVMTTPLLELENQYNEMFGSGIQIASMIPKF